MPSLAADWSNFFVAEVGAAAALSGLLFVAVSINLTRIRAIEHLHARAAETLYVLLGVLVVATFGLVPGQSLTALGFEVTGTGFAVWGICVRSQARASTRDPAARQWLLHRVVWTQVATLPFIVGGALLVTGYPSGLLLVGSRRAGGILGRYPERVGVAHRDPPLTVRPSGMDPATPDVVTGCNKQSCRNRGNGLISSGSENDVDSSGRAASCPCGARSPSACGAPDS